MYNIKAQYAYQYQHTVQNQVVWMGKIDEQLYVYCSFLKTEYDK